MSAEQNLWVAVLLVALADATAGKPGSLDRNSADTWIRRCGRDFRFVCSAAGVDPDVVRERYLAGRIDPALIPGKPGPKRAA